MPEHALQQAGIVKVLHGTATAFSDAGSRSLGQGDAVYQGETVSTGEDSALEIRFADETVLSQGENSQVTVDTYIYDPETDAGEVLFKLTQGTFRSITGKIVDQNPEKFKISSPLAVIGIRGTHTGHFVPAGGGEENHGCLEYDGKPVVVQSMMGGPPVSLFSSGVSVGASSVGLGPMQPYTPGQLDYFNALSPEAMAAGPPPVDPPPDFAPGDEPDDDPDDLPEDAGAGGPDDGEPAGGTPDDVPEEAAGGPAPEATGDAPEGTPTVTLAPQGVMGAFAGPGTGMPGETPDAVPGLAPDSENVLDDGGGLGEAGLPPLVFNDPIDPGDGPEETPDPGDDYIPEEFDVTAAPTVEAPEVVEQIESILPAETSDGDTGGEAAAPTSGTLLHGTWSGSTAYFTSYDTGVAANGVFANLGDSSVPSPYGDSMPFAVYDNTSDHESLPSQILNVYGSPQNDSLYGNDSVNTLFGQCGDDNIHGLGGADWLAGGNDADTIYGGDGDDHITGDSPFTITGLEGSDTLYGGNGNDSFYGSSGSDHIYGGDTSTDTGTKDVLSYSYPEGPYTFPNAVTVGMTGAGQGTVTGAGGTDTFSGIEEVVGSGHDDSFFGSTGNDVFDGAGGADYMTGGGGDDHMHGGTEDDNMLGDAGADELVGGTGNDTMNGGTENDTLIGEAGNDTLTGGTGADDFVYDAVAEVGAANKDVIMDFTHGEDKFVVDNSGGTAFPTNTVKEIGAPTTTDPTVFYDNATLAADYTMYYDSDGVTGGTDLSNPLATFSSDPSIDATDIVIA